MCKSCKKFQNRQCPECGMFSVSKSQVLNPDLGVVNFIFQGSPYFPLDNFYPHSPVTFEGLTYRNSEAAFQSAKNVDKGLRKLFTSMSAAESKAYGKNPRFTRLRRDWGEVKDQVMYDIVKDKMLRHPQIAELLLSTGDATIIEGNYWNDNYWGVDFSTGIGRNQLGVTLMKIREELRNGSLQAPGNRD